MLLSFFIIFLISSEHRYKYTLSLNPFSFVIYATLAGHGVGVLFLPSPGINFELGVLKDLSFNFELNNVLFVLPHELEVGVREYLAKKNFKGFYIYQGLATGLSKSFVPADPSLVLVGGYKSIEDSGFTIDPFLGAKIFYVIEKKRIFPIPAIGLYLGHSW